MHGDLSLGLGLFLLLLWLLLLLLSCYKYPLDIDLTIVMLSCQHLFRHPLVLIIGLHSAPAGGEGTW